MNIYFYLYFIYFSFYSLNNVSCNSTCLNGGIKTKLGDDYPCYCGGTGRYGSRCEELCFPYYFSYPIPEKCLNEPCSDIASSCLDVRYGLIITRPPTKTNYPECPTETLPNICYNSNILNFDNPTFGHFLQINQSLTNQCLNGGILKKMQHNATCSCLGSFHYGDRCEKDCNDFGFEIPEKCLNDEPCHLPESCVDVSRKNIIINRCQNNGLLLSGKNGTTTCFCLTSEGFFGPFCETPCSSVDKTCLQNNTCPSLYIKSCFVH